MMKMNKLPRVLNKENFKNGIDLGLWFAATWISFNLSMSAYNYAANKVNNWLQNRRYKKLQAEMERINTENQMTVSDIQTAEAVA